MYLSKSKYCKAYQCNKMLWLDKYKSEEAEVIDNQSVLQNGTNVGELAKGLFGEYLDVPYNDDLSKMIEDTNKYLENKNCNICEASFDYNGNFCSVDILRKKDNNFEIYEVKSSTEVSSIYMEDISYQYYVLRSLGLNVTRACIVHLNNNYVRHGELELDKLFKIIDVTDYAKNSFNKVENKINEINEYMDRKDEEEKEIDSFCFKPYACPYFKYCSKLPENNVFDIRGMGVNTKLKLYRNGHTSFEDLKNQKIGNKYLEQIDFELNDKGDKINTKKIKEFMKTLYYPLYFLDFETYQESIPSYDNISPYEQIPFQYSLHYYESEDSELKHTEFLAEPGVDPREELAKRLVSDIPLDVCTVAYNMMFEKGVIKKLATLYPHLSKHLMNIHDNMKDLMIPFKNRDYYNKAMKGSYSIKYVLPALFPDDPSLDYHNLDMIHNGAEASSTFAMLSSYTKEEQEEIRENMLKYCGLDTYAMVKIYKKLKSDVK